MPGLVRRVVIFAAVDGLILQPQDQRSQRAVPELQIHYTTNGSATLRSDIHTDLAHLAALEAYGIHPLQGLLNVSSTSYLISILQRQQVAQIRGNPVYVITSVALVPLSSQSAARQAIEQTKETQGISRSQILTERIDYETSTDEGSCISDGHITDYSRRVPKSLSPPYNTVQRKSHQSIDSVAQDVIRNRGQYGRFVEGWFSRKGWTTERRRAQGMSTDDMGKQENTQTREGSISAQAGNSHQELSGGLEHAAAAAAATNPSTKSAPGEAPPRKDVASTLLAKLLQTTKMLFASHSFFFSYDHDITRMLGDQITKPPNHSLHQTVDSLVGGRAKIAKACWMTDTRLQFFWNQHLAAPFIENGDHAYVLPVMQGFVGQRPFRINPSPSIDPKIVKANGVKDTGDIIDTQKCSETDSSFLLTLISRRSVRRPGLRYLRRGVDDAGHTANSVETEQILSRASWGPNGKVYSFTQYRGSIPLFFSQSPYAFKPVPVILHSFNTNHAAFKCHFSNLVSRYGDVQIALLVDKHGSEAEIGQQYEKHTKRMVAEGGVGGIQPAFEWFDFHAACRGMRFENVALLMDTLGGRLDRFGMTVEAGGHLSTRQKGVLRTNCMDCLDRTNVVQSACGSRALEKQLLEEGVKVDLQTDATTQWFNTLWADNGDAVSKQYSSTAALKGDYTRTRKRNYRGALNDFGLTLSRYYNNTVNDYFSQAAIDYLLGTVTEQVFEEFEAKMMSNDPAISMQTVRTNAIHSSKIVIADQGEDLVGAWTLMSPVEANTVRTFPFEEIILLLTDVALYAVRFDWNAEKVSSFERVDLCSVFGITHGTYITSTLTATQQDETKNVGLVIKYHPGKEKIARFNTRSLSTAVGQDFQSVSNANIAHRASTGNFFNTKRKGLLPGSSDQTAEDLDTKILAFKALPALSSFAGIKENDGAVGTISEKQLVSDICDNIKRAAYGDEDMAGSDTGLSWGFVENKEIVSLKEARRSTGYLEQWGHELKKLVWA
ncbi:MAG: hypothetical protein LQ341_000231 [Variospora aurantia]|nr:MAG: hypothetical protein LQ341_000231 [Variospora aurantia]